MKIAKKYAGKWVAIKGERVIGSDVALGALRRKMKGKKDSDDIGYGLVPRGIMVGSV